MNIVILSGGSGNDALVKGLKNFYPDSKIDIIINQYDSGKSTGICRQVTNTLGVSDARKNHIRIYKATHSTIDIDKRLVEFYTGRYDFTKGNEIDEILDKLDKWNLSQFSEYAIKFFENTLADTYEYYDFNVANIIYSQMYKELGIEMTHEIFCSLLGIKNCVHTNSYDNVWINAVTESGHIIEDEGEIVDWCNPNDKIEDIQFCDPENPFRHIHLNTKVVELIRDADLIIISTGTFWSSIYPTLSYGDLFRTINISNAKKVWAINNEEDKDSYGISSNDFIEIMNRLGLDLSKFTILENLDAIESLRLSNNNYKIKCYHMDNIDGKHDPELFVYGILACYYDLDSNYDKIIFDFDDTLYSRENSRYSKENIGLLRYLKNDTYIISGNSYRSIFDKMTPVYGKDLADCSITIVADANSNIYKFGKQINNISSMNISSVVSDILIDNLKTNFNLAPYDVCSSCIKYKPLSELERDLLVDYINKSLRIQNIVAKKTGTTTVDVVNINNDKSSIFDILNFENYNTLYIGDETDSGNDYSIARRCSKYIHVKSAEETNVIIMLLLNIGDML